MSEQRCTHQRKCVVTRSSRSSTCEAFETFTGDERGSGIQQRMHGNPWTRPSSCEFLHCVTLAVSRQHGTFIPLGKASGVQTGGSSYCVHVAVRFPGNKAESLQAGRPPGRRKQADQHARWRAQGELGVSPCGMVQTGV
jgi:hypothetical protein